MHIYFIVCIPNRYFYEILNCLLIEYNLFYKIFCIDYILMIFITNYFQNIIIIINK